MSYDDTQFSPLSLVIVWDSFYAADHCYIMWFQAEISDGKAQVNGLPAILPWPNQCWLSEFKNAKYINQISDVEEIMKRTKIVHRFRALINQIATFTVQISRIISKQTQSLWRCYSIAN